MKSNKVAARLRQIHETGRKGIAWLVDPDEVSEFEELMEMVLSADELKIDFIFLGGSLLHHNHISPIIREIKKTTQIPLVIFPGSAYQFSEEADAILFLSLISGRNPDLLIGQHVQVAPLLEKSNLEVLPTGYMLIDGGEKTSVHYISQTIPLPNHHPDLSVATALAGKFLGLQYFYMDAGSGAPEPVSPELIKAVKKKVKAPLIVGGGLNDIDKIKTALLAGADLIVLGNGVGKKAALLRQASEFLESYRILAN